MIILLLFFICIPLYFSAWNITNFVIYLIKKTDKQQNKTIEIVAIIIGIIFSYFLLYLTDVKFIDWNEALLSIYTHTPINTQHFLTVVVLSITGLIGYFILRWVPVNKQPPLLSAISIAGMYIGAFICIMWCLQMPTLTENFINIFYILFPLNLLLLYMKTIFVFTFNKSEDLKCEKAQTKFTKLSLLLNKSINIHWIALIILIPVLGIIILILILFGQTPDSIIKAWTETAEWTLSQKIAPYDIPYDAHYLCTVAAKGHVSIVKPLRTGIRNGHRVLVNRQLCIANAFEDLIKEKTPRFHKAVRTFYDKTGYPISKHIHSKFIADGIYFIMKPLEWLFLLVLYMLDTKPENRIAIQYPHSDSYKII